jgi:hypothetical protein
MIVRLAVGLVALSANAVVRRSLAAMTVRGVVVPPFVEEAAPGAAALFITVLGTELFTRQVPRPVIKLGWSCASEGASVTSD